ncbi:MAG: hypothetical protein Q8P02_03405, partial [Candidatus Micrarchaeota archaeon]|nr:hypothetical protein [Candidatus Micrarchaeota archaeon]
VLLKATLTLKSYASDGLARVKDVLAALCEPPEGDQKLDIRYVSAPTYQVDVEAADFKQAEKTMKRLQKTLDEKASGADFEKELVVAN